jgi:hypothetical protein
MVRILNLILNLVNGWKHLGLFVIMNFSLSVELVVNLRELGLDKPISDITILNNQFQVEAQLILVLGYVNSLKYIERCIYFDSSEVSL